MVTGNRQMAKNHKDLEVWKEAVQVSVVCYDVTRAFPSNEQFGLVSQMRRAAVSIASNIAEGAARAGHREFIQYLHISLASASELDTHIEIAKRVGFGNSSDLERLQSRVNSVSRMLQGLIRSVKDKRLTGSHQSQTTHPKSPVTAHESPPL